MPFSNQFNHHTGIGRDSVAALALLDWLVSSIILGFCGIDCQMNMEWYCIWQENNNSSLFLKDVVNVISDGFLFEGDVLILDNVAISPRGKNNVSANWRCLRHGIALPFLPIHLPEPN